MASEDRVMYCCEKVRLLYMRTASGPWCSGLLVPKNPSLQRRMQGEGTFRIHDHNGHHTFEITMAGE